MMMRGKTKKQKYYLIGKGNSLYAFSYGKYDAERICFQRKGYRYKKLKDKDADELIENSSLSEIVQVVGTNVLMSMDEENYFLESFGQYQSDVVCWFDKILERLKFIKYTNEDAEYIAPVIKEMHEYVVGMKTGTLFESEDSTGMEYWDYEEAAKWFLKNVIKTKIREENMI